MFKTAYQIQGKTYTNINLHFVEQSSLLVRRDDMYWLDKAIQLSCQSVFNGHKVGCVLVNQGRMISMAVNCNKTHPLAKQWGCNRHMMHAEIAALVRAKVDLQGSTAYVARAGAGMLGRCSYPCKSCLPALRNKGVEQVVCFDAMDQPARFAID